MALKRLDNVGIVVTDLDAAIAFFTELGMELEGRAVIDGEWSAHVTGLPGNKAEIAMLRTPGGSGRIELARYLNPIAVEATPAITPPNTVGLTRTMFAVDDIDDTVARLERLGGSVVDEIVQYENSYRLCYMRGPDNIIVGLAEDLGG